MATNPNAKLDLESIINHKLPETNLTYTERDVALYALGIGAAADPLDEKELQYVYHKDGQKFVKVLPTFATILISGSLTRAEELPGFKFDPRLLLHGQQYIEIYRPLPSSAYVQNKEVVAGFHDKGKAALVEVEIISYDKNSGEALCKNRISYFIRGAGGFSKSSTPYSYSNYPADQVLPVKIPKSQPFKVYEDRTQKSQALLYRLSGDYNPLHSDPEFASVGGFSRPIQHGLCTLGFAVRAIIKCLCNGDPALVKVIFGRFLLHVYPGETLITEMWPEGSRVIFQTKVKERNGVCLVGYVGLNKVTSSM